MGGLLLLALAAASLALAGIGAAMLRSDVRLEARVRASVGGGATFGAGPLRLLPRMPALLSPRGRDREEIERGLQRAGHFHPGALDAFIWLRIGAAALAALASMATCLLVTGHPLRPVFPTFAAAGLGFIGAKYALRMRAATRERRLTNEFPFLLDLMLMMLESGVSLDQCFRAISRDETVAVPRHARLMAMLVDDLDRGQDYVSALDRWAARVPVNGARELAGLFAQSLFQGMELVPALRQFGQEFSQRRVARAREAIGRITVRMVVLMLVFFMPALFIVLAGPPVTVIFDTLGSMKR